MRRSTIKLAANQQLPFDLTGSMVKVLACTGAFSIRAENRAKARILSDDLEVDVGVKLRLPDFDLLRVKDTSGAANTILLLVGDGDHDTDTVVGSVTVEHPGTLDSQADQNIAAAASFDIAANASRRELILEAAAGNSDDLLVRDQAGVTSEGIRLKPGERLFLSYKGALRVRNNSAAAQDLYIVEMTA